MPVFQNLAARLYTRYFPKDVATFTVRVTPRIAHFVIPIVERLIRDDKIGETYRCAVALWHRWDEPPLTMYQGTVSLCRVNGPSLTAEGANLPAGGLVEAPGLTARLSSQEAHNLDNRLKTAIEQTIRDWADETNRGPWKTLPQHQHRGPEDA